MADVKHKRHHSSQQPPSPLIFQHGQTFVPKVLHDIILRFCTVDDRLSLGLLSRSANLFFQQHLASSTSLIFTEDDSPNILPAALRHCRRLTTLEFYPHWYARSLTFLEMGVRGSFRTPVSSIAKLITKNAATFQELRGTSDHPDIYLASRVVLKALASCPSLRSLCVNFLALTDDLMSKLLSRPALQSFSVAECGEDAAEGFCEFFQIVPSSLTSLATPVYSEDMLRQISKMSSLTCLKLHAHWPTERLTLLQKLPALTELHLFADYESIDARFVSIASHHTSMARFLETRGYSWKDSAYITELLAANPNPGPDMVVLDLPQLKTLVMRFWFFNTVFVKSQHLQTVDLKPVPIRKPREYLWATLLGLEMIRESPDLRFFSLAESAIDKNAKSLFLQLCSQWRHLTYLDFASLDSDMLRDIGKFCPRLEVLHSDYSKEADVPETWLSVLSLPRLRELVVRETWGCPSMIFEGTVDIGKVDAPSFVSEVSFDSPLLCPHLSRLEIPPNKNLLNCLRCPSLRYLNITGSSSVVSNLDGLALGSSASLFELQINSAVGFEQKTLAHAPSSSPASASSSTASSPWSLFSRLEKVAVGCKDNTLLEDLVKHVKCLKVLSFVPASFELENVIQSANPSLKTLCIYQDRGYIGFSGKFRGLINEEAGRWMDHVETEVVTPLLVLEKLPPNLKSIEIYHPECDPSSQYIDIDELRNPRALE